jgi:hypothetical protein
MSRDFEDDLLEELQEYVGDDGIAMRRRQEYRMRGGKFQADQFVDLMVDSPKPEYYLGIEAKKATDGGSGKFYFSNHYPRDQVRSQSDYSDKSGREVFTAVKIRDHEGEDVLLLFPVEYFLQLVEDGEAGVEFDELVSDGVEWTDGFTAETLAQARDMRSEV